MPNGRTESVLLRLAQIPERHASVSVIPYALPSPFSNYDSVTFDLRIGIGPSNPGNTGPETLDRSLATWQEVQEFFAEDRPLPMLVDRAPEHWYEVSVDATPMLEYLEAALQHATERFRRIEQVRITGVPITDASWEPEIPDPSLILRITPVGASPGDEPPLRVAGRFLQQLFLAVNISAPGSCNLSRCEYLNVPEESRPFRAPILDVKILDDALFDALSLDEGWPELRRVPFRGAWEWLHRDMAYDIEVAKDPLQKAIFGILRICTREQWDPDNLLVLVQAFEGLLQPGRGRNKQELHQRLELVIGSPPADRDWFREFYGLRGRIIHGSAPVLRPGGYDHLDPEASRISDAAAYFESRAVGALLALLQDMVIHNCRTYRFDLLLIREPW